MLQWSSPRESAGGFACPIMNSDTIHIKGARHHNLKNINLDIPKNKMVVFTGVSGSGKSSLAFDTIYAEGQRRYVESLSSYARQFLGVMQKPDVDLIEGLSPAISIDQKTTSHNPRSTVGTVTEIYDYLRLLFARVGHPHCPVCGREIMSQSLDQIVDGVLGLIDETTKRKKIARFLILSPVVRDRKGEFSSLFSNLRSKGFRQIRVDGIVKNLEEELVLIKTNKHTIEAVVDKISVSRLTGVYKQNFKIYKQNFRIYKQNLKSRLADSLSQALDLSDGLVIASLIKDKGFELPERPKEFEDHLFSEKFSCPIDNIQLPEIEPRTFSFNSPHGACPKCLGLGKILKVNSELIFSKNLTLAEGAILPFSTIFENDTWYSRLILEVCRQNSVDYKKPIRILSREDREILLYGTGGKIYKVNGNNRFGRKTSIYEAFDGIVAELERKHSSTESEHARMIIERYMTEVLCPDCGGARLKKQALSITIDGKSINMVSSLPINTLVDWIKKLEDSKVLSQREKEIGNLILKEIKNRLFFLKSVGLEYLSLDRGASTLSGGEAQRIRLASQVGSGLTGVLYVLDEPTIGLHPRDNLRLIATLKKLKDLGNSIIVVEHDKEMMEASDLIIDFGPGAGKHGGEVVSQGTPKEIKEDAKSLTGKYLSGKKKIIVNRGGHKGNQKEIRITGVNQFNLKNIDVALPLGKLIAVTGVSGSGKSTFAVETLYNALVKNLNPYSKREPGKYKTLNGAENIDKVSLIDQSPIGRTPRSNPATYTKVFDLIRNVFASTKEARASGFNPGRFSFNVKSGRCEACEGQGQIKIEMQFMADIWVACEVCHGKRYNNQTLEVFYKGKNIADVLSMTIEEAKEFFHNHGGIVSKLETLSLVGLGYMELGQPATTLSGGEAQRVKLAAELAKKRSGYTFYILDEPTTGLHFSDLEKLLRVLNLLVEKGNTVLVIEHNLDVIKNADWIIDLGPEGGDNGGELIAQGPPEEISKIKNSYTGQFLKK